MWQTHKHEIDSAFWMWLVIMQSKINFLKFLSSHHICDVEVDVRLEVPWQWDVVPCCPIGVYQCFYLQGWSISWVDSKQGKPSMEGSVMGVGWDRICDWIKWRKEQGRTVLPGPTYASFCSHVCLYFSHLPSQQRGSTFEDPFSLLLALIGSSEPLSAWFSQLPFQSSRRRQMFLWNASKLTPSHRAPIHRR